MKPAWWFLALCACGGGSMQMADKPGTCTAPTQLTLPFTAPATSETSGTVDDVAVTCGAPSDLAEAVYAFTLATAGGVQVTATDVAQGMGVGIDVREGVSCTGFSRFCHWDTDGKLDERVALPAGKYVLILERFPRGRFDLKVE